MTSVSGPFRGLDKLFVVIDIFLIFCPYVPSPFWCITRFPFVVLLFPQVSKPHPGAGGLLIEAPGSGQPLPPHVGPLGQDEDQSNPAKRKRTFSPSKVCLFLTRFISSPYFSCDFLCFISKTAG